MRRLVGLILICVSIATAFVALVIFGPPIRYLSSPTYTYWSVEVIPAALWVLPVLAVFALGVVLLVLPRPKRRDLPPSGDAP